MASIVPITPLARSLMEEKTNLPAISENWQNATDKQRCVALDRERFLQPIMEHIGQGVSANVSVRNILAKLEAKELSTTYWELATALGKKGKFPGRSTILGWVKDYKAQGKSGLIDHHTGRVRKDYGWESQAINLFHNSNKPSYQWVARRLREYHDFASATDSRVTKYLKALPATLGSKSPQRIGRHLYNNSQKHYIHRTTENLPVGALYQADGHTIDVYLEHPVSGHGAWRAELTLFMDVRSRYVVGWELSGAESGIATIQAIGRSLLNHNHVPPLLYVDNGCGYKSKIMNDEAVGFYDRLGIEPIFALPGNAKAKGQVERFFRTMERDFGVSFGEAFCGEGHSKEVARVWHQEVKSGLKRAPTLAQWCDEFTTWLDHYHNRPHPELKNTTPEALWRTLDATPINIDPRDLFNARAERVVQRAAITLDKRKYHHPSLLQHNASKVVCEYNFEDDTLITIRDQKGRLICDAELVVKQDYLPQSRIEEARIKSTKAAVKRLEVKIQEKKLRAGTLIENNHQYEELHTLQNELPKDETPDVPCIDIDLNEFD